MGVRHALFPLLTLGANLAASFPTPFSTASGVFRPHSRAVQRLTVAELLSEASWLAWAGVCGRRLANQVKTRLRLRIRVLTSLRWVGHRGWRCVGPVPRV